MGGNVKRARLWGIEKGTLPYSGLLIQLAALYSKTPEEIIEEATGQSSLDLLGSLLAHLPQPTATRHQVVMSMTIEEEQLIKRYLDWLRYCEVMGSRTSS